MSKDPVDIAEQQRDYEETYGTQEQRDAEKFNHDLDEDNTMENTTLDSKNKDARRTKEKPIAEQVAELRTQIIKLQNRVGTAETKLVAARSKIAAIDSVVVERTLGAITKRTKEFSDRVAIDSFKHMVLTEMNFFAPSLSTVYKIVKAFDLPDAWWKERERLTMNEWEALFVDMKETRGFLVLDGAMSSEESSSARRGEESEDAK